MKSGFIAAAAAVLAATPALAQDAEPEFVTIDMQIDVDAPAEVLWERVGDFCDIEEWGGLTCEITEGDGEIGTVRSLFGGVVVEVLVGKTDLSYGYAIPDPSGQQISFFHGFMEARPVTDTTSRMIYTLVYDVSNLEDEAAVEADMAQRRGMFEPMLEVMKETAEAE